ncbi:MAG TPA: hypothetical protein VHM01_06680 [Alphaproteobacteria bacterium]|nr:hypothetical protein [Alphaproteobacteria bacterium]
MADAQVDQPSPGVQPAPVPAQAPAQRRLIADPEDRPVIVLSSEPRRHVRPKARRALSVAKKACLLVVVAVASLILLAFLVEPLDEPGRTPAQSVSIRG